MERSNNSYTTRYTTNKLHIITIIRITQELFYSNWISQFSLKLSLRWCDVYIETLLGSAGEMIWCSWPLLRTPEPHSVFFTMRILGVDLKWRQSFNILHILVLFNSLDFIFATSEIVDHFQRGRRTVPPL